VFVEDVKGVFHLRIPYSFFSAVAKGGLPFIEYSLFRFGINLKNKEKDTFSACKKRKNAV
jgi:hypothetical protein